MSRFTPDQNQRSGRGLALFGELQVAEVPPGDCPAEPRLEVDASVELQRGRRVLFCAGPVSQFQVDGCAVQRVRCSGRVELDRGGEIGQRQVEIEVGERGIALRREWEGSVRVD